MLYRIAPTVSAFVQYFICSERTALCAAKGSPLHAHGFFPLALRDHEPITHAGQGNSQIHRSRTFFVCTCGQLPLCHLSSALFEFKVYRKDESRHLMQALCLSTRPTPQRSHVEPLRRSAQSGSRWRWRHGHGPRATGGRTQVDALLQNYDGNTPPPPPVSLELGLPASSNIWRSLPWPGVATATSRA